MMPETYLKQLREVANRLSPSGQAEISDDALTYADSATWEMWQNHVPGIVKSLWPIMDEQSRLVAYVTAKRIATSKQHV